MLGEGMDQLRLGGEQGCLVDKAPVALVNGQRVGAGNPTIMATPAKQAKLNGPKGVAWSRDGGIYIADTESHVIRRIDLKSGVIMTVLGTGEKGDGPETDPLKCKLARPHGVFVDKKGKLYVGDSESNRVRVVE